MEVVAVGLHGLEAVMSTVWSGVNLLFLEPCRFSIVLEGVG